MVISEFWGAAWRLDVNVGSDPADTAIHVGRQADDESNLLSSVLAPWTNDVQILQVRTRFLETVRVCSWRSQRVNDAVIRYGIVSKVAIPAVQISYDTTFEPEDQRQKVNITQIMHPASCRHMITLQGTNHQLEQVDASKLSDLII